MCTAHETVSSKSTHSLSSPSLHLKRAHVNNYLQHLTVFPSTFTMLYRTEQYGCYTRCTLLHETNSKRVSETHAFSYTHSSERMWCTSVDRVSGSISSYPELLEILYPGACNAGLCVIRRQKMVRIRRGNQSPKAVP